MGLSLLFTWCRYCCLYIMHDELLTKRNYWCHICENLDDNLWPIYISYVISSLGQTTYIFFTRLGERVLLRLFSSFLFFQILLFCRLILILVWRACPQIRFITVYFILVISLMGFIHYTTQVLDQVKPSKWVIWNVYWLFKFWDNINDWDLMILHWD